VKHIIHFTKSFSIIKKILKTSSLRLVYCQEVFYLGNERISSAAHPMVCFSEYAFEDLANKTITYGQYGIAFTDHWVKKNKIHPVLYIEQESVVANALAQLLRARQNKGRSRLPDHLRLPIMTIKCFTKNTVGPNIALNKKDFNFREESEWRYVPKKKDIDYGLISLNKSTYLNDKISHNKKLIRFPLKFDNNDIERIFVSTASEAKAVFETFNIERKRIQISNWKT
jgi:hypothetical protein